MRTEKVTSDDRETRFLRTDLDAEAVFEGPTVDNHEIDAGLLGRALLFIQDVARDLTRGNAAWKLKAALAPGSFHIRFRLIDEPAGRDDNGQIALEDADPARADLAPVSGIDALVELLAGGADKSRIASTLQTTEAKRAYADLMRLLSHQKVDFQFRTRRHPQGASITAAQARDISDWLREKTVATRTFAIVGELRGANLNTGSFEILTSSGAISGRSSDPAKDHLRGLRLGTVVRAVIAETYRNHIDLDAPEHRYMLESIEDLQAPRLDFDA